MTRLLLPLLAALALQTPVNAFPFGKNLEFKNDIGTKTLIKGNAVYSEYLTVEDLKTATNDYWNNSFFSRMKRRRSLESERMDYEKKFNMYSQGGILEKSEYAPSQLALYKKKIGEVEKAIKDNEEAQSAENKLIKQTLNNLDTEQSIKIHAVNLSFDPILIDLNKNQKIQSTVNLTCVNQQLKPELRDAWYKYYPRGQKGLPLEIRDYYLKKNFTICKKYAKFK